MMKSKIREIIDRNPLRFVTRMVVGTVVFLLALVFMVGFFFAGDTGFNYRSIYYFGVRPNIIVTGSMVPEIAVNSIVNVEDVKFDDIEIGDIIRYNAKNNLSVVHRVVAIGRDYLITKGDANDDIDAFPVTEDMLNGKVTSIHNEYAPVLTLILGTVDVNNFGKSAVRALIGLFISATVLAFACLGAYWIFELWSINFYWLKRHDKMRNSTLWRDEFDSRDRFNDMIIKYKTSYDSANLFNKIIILLRFHKYYDVICTVEKHAKREMKYKKKLIKALNSSNKQLTCSKDTKTE